MSILGRISSPRISGFGLRRIRLIPAASTYPTAGTFDYLVPAGIISVTVTVVAGGGGGGGSIFSGDGHGGANGGSGGFYSNQTIAVTPGETLSIVVGDGGAGNTGGAGTQGTRGGSSSISRGGTPLFTATGGFGGNGVTGDNAPGNTNPPNGSVGGSPGGVAGSHTATWMVNRNTAGQALDGKGTNGTGYGTGGLGEQYSGSPLATKGGVGFVSITPL
jgi:hypothetical protein